MEKEQLINDVKNALDKLKNELKRDITNPNRLNIFYILNLSENELAHSRFIAFLLNPKESHGYKHDFLNKFINILNIDFKFECESVRIEHPVGKYGRIDIIIKNKDIDVKDKKLKKHIVIENKIYAQDEGKQLIRYQQAYPGAKIVYLTPDGHSASKESLIDRNNNKSIKEEDYIKISYKHHIIKWLKLCKLIILSKTMLNKNDKKLINFINEYLEIVKIFTKYLHERDRLIPILTSNKNTVEIAFEIYKKYYSKFKDVKKLNDDNHEYPQYKIFKLMRILKTHIIKTRFCKKEDQNSFLNILCNDDSLKNKNLDWETNGVRRVLQEGWGFYIYKKNDKNNKIEFRFKKKIFQKCSCFYMDGENQKTEDLPKEYFNWYKDVFVEDIMSENYNKTGLFEILKNIINSKIE